MPPMKRVRKAGKAKICTKCNKKLRVDGNSDCWRTARLCPECYDKSAIDAYEINHQDIHSLFGEIKGINPAMAHWRYITHLYLRDIEKL